jgi:L-threonylcarbamoyladenylate synthase
MRQSHRLNLADAADFERALPLALESLRDGGVVLLPTDTVYGLMCLPTQPEAVRGIYAMKQRPSDRRLPIVVADLEQGVRTLPLDWTPSARALARAFWPGALTIACGVLPDAGGWLAGRDEAAVRAPRHALVQALAREAGPLLMTSANRHGAATPHTLHGALGDLAEPPALALDGGKLTGASSTLVNVNLPRPVIERRGVLASADIAEALGDS